MMDVTPANARVRKNAKAMSEPKPPSCANSGGSETKTKPTP